MFKLIKKVDDFLRFVIYFPLAMLFQNYPRLFKFFIESSGAELVTKEELEKDNK